MDRRQVWGLVRLVVLLLAFWFILTNLDGMRDFALGLWGGTIAFFEFWLYLIEYEIEVFVTLIITIAITLCSIYFTAYRMWQKPIYLHSETWKIDKLVGRVTWIKGSGTGIIYTVWRALRVMAWAFVNLAILVMYPFRWIWWRWKGLAYGFRPVDRPKMRLRKFKTKQPMAIPIGDSHYTEGVVIYIRRLGCFWRDVWPWRMPKVYYPMSKERPMDLGTWKVTLQGYNLKFHNDPDPSKAHFELDSDTMVLYEHPLAKYEKDLKLIELEAQLKVEKAIGSDSEMSKEERRKFTVLSPTEMLKVREEER